MGIPYDPSTRGVFSSQAALTGGVLDKIASVTDKPKAHLSLCTPYTLQELKLRVHSLKHHLPMQKVLVFLKNAAIHV